MCSQPNKDMNTFSFVYVYDWRPGTSSMGHGSPGLLTPPHDSLGVSNIPSPPPSPPSPPPQPCPHPNSASAKSEPSNWPLKLWGPTKGPPRLE